MLPISLYYCYYLCCTLVTTFAAFLDSGYTAWKFYDSKSRYALEQESSEAKGEFLQLYDGGSSVPMPSFAATSGRKAKGRKEAAASQMLSIELRTPNGTMMRIQGEMGQDFIQSIIRASSGHV